MGRWGERMFEGDNDYDIVAELNHEAGFELYFYESEEDGKGLEGTRKALNEGVLDKLFIKYKNSSQGNWMGLEPSKEYKLVVIGALAMHVGATIKAEDLDMLRLIYKEVPYKPKNSLTIFGDNGFRGPGKLQFARALENYKNDGSPINFYAGGIVGAANSGGACNRCGTYQSELLAQGQPKLKTCAKCKSVMYCDRECQRADWRGHKAACATGGNQGPSASGNFIMMNV